MSNEIIKVPNLASQSIGTVGTTNPILMGRVSRRQILNLYSLADLATPLNRNPSPKGRGTSSLLPFWQKETRRIKGEIYAAQS
ncbi:MAG: hypothetical protein HLUCCO16_17475 [Phormidium sp. OSCR]|nr:MAG: hypothetical protein HLUCCO16_17475 [Phormidium sp. OSCR]